MEKKRGLSIFAAVEELNSQDRRADGKRRKETSAEKQRAVEVQSQTKIYNHLLESRILLQRAINNVNSGDDLLSDGKVSRKQDASTSSLRGTCNALIEKLLRARNQISESKHKIDANKYKCVLSSSLTASLHNSLQDEYDRLKEDWRIILNRRHKNLSLHSGITAKSQFRVMDSSFWEQVEATMEYEEIRIMNASENSRSKNEKKILFDDSKVYQQLLKDFVANSTNGVGTDSFPQRLRSSTKHKNNNNNMNQKDVDRRASKGRKIRYKEIPNLVNFTFPLSRPNTSNLNQDEYFQSLFGGAGASNN
mmetsp:Transcript_955/g.1097  ORF Transcript_955/g.1097 Transcript_955/m.1097 type:complete len:307 (+) Transcript_955:259-1179(+)